MIQQLQKLYRNIQLAKPKILQIRCPCAWSIKNRMQLNPDKCKELRISFNAKPRSFDPIVVNGKELEVVTNFKLWVLILTIN